jgi:hypothetical protein
MEHLPESDRWIAASPIQTLWPYQHMVSKSASVQATIIVVYPDIYPLNEYGDSCTSVNAISSDLTNDWLTSALPLLRVMGAFIASDLNDNVTHVLCDLISSNDEIVYNERTDVNIFTDRHRGRALMERLRTLLCTGTRSDHNGTTITLITPNWVRKRKWCSGSTMSP